MPFAANGTNKGLFSGVNSNVHFQSRLGPPPLPTVGTDMRSALVRFVNQTDRADLTRPYRVGPNDGDGRVVPRG